MERMKIFELAIESIEKIILLIKLNLISFS